MKKHYLIYLLFALVTITGCGKDEEDPIILVKDGNNEIFSFKITSISPGVEGKIDASTNSIILEVPASTDLKSIAPSISVSEKASISPKSGNAVDFTNPVKYIVTAEDGNSKEYVVTIKKLPFPIQLKYVDLIVASDSVSGLTDKVELLSYHRINGKYFSKVSTENKVYLVNTSGSSYEMKTVLSDSTFIGFLISETVPVGAGYKIKVKVNSQESIFSKTIEVVLPKPEVKSLSKTAITAGETIEIEGKYFGIVKENISVKLSLDSKSYICSIISVEDGKIVVEIPEGTPFGKYSLTVIRDEAQRVAEQKLDVSSSNKIVITDINKTTFAKGQTIVFTGKNFGTSEDSAYLIFTKVGSTDGELRFGTSNDEGTTLSFYIPSNLAAGVYTIQLTLDIKELTDFESEITITE